jgi:hypothetical protein
VSDGTKADDIALALELDKVSAQPRETASTRRR